MPILMTRIRPGNRQVGTTHGIHCLIGLSPGSVNTYIWICQQPIPAAGQPAAEQPLCPEGLRPRVEACPVKWCGGQVSVCRSDAYSDLHPHEPHPRCSDHVKELWS